MNPVPNTQQNPEKKTQHNRPLLALQKRQTYPWHSVHIIAHDRKRTEAITLTDMSNFPNISIFKEINAAFFF